MLMFEKGKALIMSTTFQVAVLQAAAGLITVLTTNYPALVAVGWLAVVKSVVDILLRLKTSQPISGFLPKKN